MSVSSTNHPDKSIVDCSKQVSGAVTPQDAPPPFCGREEDDNLRGVNTPTLNWLDESAGRPAGAGANCDPMKAGRITNDPESPDRETVYRLEKGLRNVDQAMLDLFTGLVVIDDDGKSHGVPIIYASQEKAVAWIVQDNARDDNTLVVDRPRLPLLAIAATSFSPDRERFTYHYALDYMRRQGRPGFAVQEKRPRDTVFGRARGVPWNVGYTLFLWTKYLADADQVFQQVVTKFSPVAYIRVRGVVWEVVVELDGVENLVEFEPGDMKERFVKFKFNMTAKTYMPQPLQRRKAVLGMNIEVAEGLDIEEMSRVADRVSVLVEGITNC